MKNILWISAELIRIAWMAAKVLLVGLLSGVALALLHIQSSPGGALLSGLRHVYDLVGIAIVGLLPLSIWVVWLGVKHFRHPGGATEQELYDYEYIASAAPTWGLLGTVVALVMAGAAMATRISEGSSADMIIGIIPMVTQALISTVVGLIIQWLAETARHLVERRQLVAQESLVS